MKPRTDLAPFLLTALSLALLAAPAAAQEQRPWTVQEIKETLERMQLKEARAVGYQMRWEDLGKRPHTEAERLALLAVWKEKPPPLEQELLLYALCRDADPRVRAVVDAVLADPPTPAVLCQAVAHICYTGKPRDAAILAPLLSHEEVIVRAWAAKGLRIFSERMSQRGPNGRWQPAPRPARIFKQFRPLLLERLNDSDKDVRVLALRSLLMLSASEAELPLEALRQASRSDYSELRYTAAKAAGANPGLPFHERLLALTVDKNMVVAVEAIRALTNRLALTRPRAERARLIDFLEADLSKKDSLVARAPRLLLALGDQALAARKDDAAFDYYQRCAQASLDGGIDPGVYGYHAGASARANMISMLLGRKQSDDARALILKTHTEFNDQIDVRLPGGEKRPLILVLQKLHQPFGPPKWPPRVGEGLGYKPGRAKEPRSHGKKKGEERDHDHGPK